MEKLKKLVISVLVIIFFLLFGTKGALAQYFSCSTPSSCPESVPRRSWQCADTWIKCGTGDRSCASATTCSDDCCAGSGGGGYRTSMQVIFKIRDGAFVKETSYSDWRVCPGEKLNDLTLSASINEGDSWVNLNTSRSYECYGDVPRTLLRHKSTENTAKDWTVVVGLPADYPQCRWSFKKDFGRSTPNQTGTNCSSIYLNGVPIGDRSLLNVTLIAAPTPTVTLTPTPTVRPGEPTPTPVNKPPTCNIVEAQPASDTQPPPVTVEFKVNTADSDGTVRNARWFIDGAWHASSKKEGNSFYLTYQLMTAGNFPVRVRVADNLGELGFCDFSYTVTDEPSSEPGKHWFQAKSGDIHAGSLIRSLIPDSVETMFLLEPDGVVSYGVRADPELNDHPLSENNWKVRSYRFNYTDSPYTFSYFETNINKRREFGDLGNGAVLLEGGRLAQGGSNESIAGASTWLVNGDVYYKGGVLGSKVYLVKGRLLIEADIASSQNPIFIVEGDIEVDGEVQNLSGVFITDGQFKTNTGEQLKVMGTVKATGFSFDREGADINEPSEFFSYDPWYVARIPGIIPGLGVKLIRWEEVAP